MAMFRQHHQALDDSQLPCEFMGILRIEPSNHPRRLESPSHGIYQLESIDLG
jgi:hypothetical protein